MLQTRVPESCLCKSADCHRPDHSRKWGQRCLTDWNVSNGMDVLLQNWYSIGCLLELLEDLCSPHGRVQGRAEAAEGGGTKVLEVAASEFGGWNGCLVEGFLAVWQAVLYVKMYVMFTHHNNYRFRTLQISLDNLSISLVKFLASKGEQSRMLGSMGGRYQGMHSPLGPKLDRVSSMWHSSTQEAWGAIYHPSTLK